MIEEGLVALYEAHDANRAGLHDKPDKEFADDLIYQVYSDIVKRGD